MNKTWAKAAAIRALRTVAQTVTSAIGTTAVIGGVNWTWVLSVAAGAGIVSLAMSVAGLPEVKEK